MIRWGIIGLGNIAKRFAEAIKPCTTGQIVAIASKTKEKQDKFKKLLGHDVLCFDDYDALVESNEVDAIYIAVPHGMHFTWAKKAILNKKHVLCEKPMTLSVKDTQELANLAKENHVLLMEAMKNKFIPSYINIIKQVKDGLIGDVNYIEANFCYKVPLDINAPGWYLLDNKQGGALYDVGPYPLSVLTDFKDGNYEKLEVEARRHNSIDSYCKATFTYPDLTFVLEVAIDENKERFAIIKGTKGTLKIPYYYRPNDYELTFEDGTTQHIEDKLDKADMFYEIDTFNTLASQGITNAPNFTVETSILQAQLIEDIKAKL